MRLVLGTVFWLNASPEWDTPRSQCYSYAIQGLASVTCELFRAWVLTLVQCFHACAMLLPHVCVIGSVRVPWLGHALAMPRPVRRLCRSPFWCVALRRVPEGFACLFGFHAPGLGRCDRACRSLRCLPRPHACPPWYPIPWSAARAGVRVSVLCTLCGAHSRRLALPWSATSDLRMIEPSGSRCS